MSVELPQSGAVFLPIIPTSLRNTNKELYDYLYKLDSVIASLSRGHFNNASNIVEALSSGTSGSFVVASGGHILVTSGVVTAVSTT